MPKQTLFGGIIVIIIIGIVFIMTDKKDSTTENPATETTGTESAQSFKDLLAQRTPVSCTFGGDVDTMNIKGTVYVGNGSIRGDYLMSGPQSPNGMETYMIMDGTSMRYWTSISTQGFKTAIDPETMEPTKTNTPQTVNYNQDFEYNCSPWIVDASKFTPPSTISFTDLNVPTKATGGNVMTGSKTQQCAACDLVPDASGKAQCKAAMQCN